MALSKRERDRLVVLRQVKEGKLKQKAAARQLGLSPRWVKKLVKRIRPEGDRGLAHRLRGRPSNRAHQAQTQQRVLTLVREHYGDYGPTLASEVLARDHGLAVNRETLRQWMSRAGLWKSRRAKLKRVHVWRARRSQRGELVPWDTSTHDWLEGRGPKLYLTAMIDDASSELVARFASSDSTEENLRLLGRYLEQSGRPVAVYTDKASLFQVNRPLHHNKHLDGKPQPTQIERALAALDIRRVTAHSPQAKGRVERCFGTLQDRLVKALRRVGAGEADTEAQEGLDGRLLDPQRGPTAAAAARNSSRPTGSFRCGRHQLSRWQSGELPTLHNQGNFLNCVDTKIGARGTRHQSAKWLGQFFGSGFLACVIREEEEVSDARITACRGNPSQRVHSLPYPH